MRGNPIYKEVSLGSVRFEGILEEIRSNSFTGLMKVSYWEMEDHIYYLRGKAVGGLREFSKGRRESIEPEPYPLSSERGLLSLYATSPVEILAFMESLEDRITPHTFTIYGEELIAPIQLSHTDTGGILKEVEYLGVNGYMLFTQRDKFDAFVAFAGGKPVAVWQSGGFTHSGGKVLPFDPQSSYLCMFRTEPEFVNLVASLDTLKKIDSIKLSSGAEVKRLIEKLNEGFRLIELVISYGLRLFILMLGRSPVLKLLNDKGEVFKDRTIPPVEGDYAMRIYSLELARELSPISLKIDTLLREISYVPREKLLAINRAFVEEIGPVGPLVWRKVFERMGFEVDRLPEDSFHEFVKMLAEEIPDKRHADRFLEKTRRWLS